MKKLYLFLGLLLVGKISTGQLLTEDFNYTAGQLLTNNGWTAHSGAGTNAITVTSPGLTYTGHTGSGVGNAVSMTTSGEDANRSFTETSSGSLYFSFLVNLSAAQATGDYFIGVLQSSSIFPIRVYAKADGSGGFNFGVSKGNSTVSYETTSRNFGTTYFIVANYLFNTGSTSDDVINLWVNPSLGGAETPGTIANVTGSSSDATSIVGVYLRQGSGANASTQQVDAILVGTTWEDVTPSAGTAPTLTAGTISDFGSITVGEQSTSQNFTLTGENLTGAPGDITITAPSTDFEVSNDNTNWNASTTVPYTTATLGAVQVYVRFTPQSAGLKTGNITISGGGASANVAVSGTGSAASVPAAPVATAATVVTNSSFVANWNPVSGATGYYIDVYTLSGGGGTVEETIAGWDFGVNTVASQTANLGNSNNQNIAVINGVSLGTISYPGGPSGTSGTPNPYSVSANGWDNGVGTKAWETVVNTTDVSDIKVSSLQGASNTGPSEFKLQYKIGAGGTWTDVTGGTVTLTVAVVPANLATWASLENVALPTECNNQAELHLRWVCNTTTAVNGNQVAAGGTSRISAVYIKGLVAGGGGPTPVYVHQNLSVGNVTSHEVTGLDPATTYYYVVRAEGPGGTSANSNEIEVTTLVGVSPVISTTALSSFGNICINTTTSPGSFTINGANLTTDDITVGPLDGFGFSTTSGGTYTPSLSLTQSGGTFSQEIFVQFSPTATQSYNGNIVVDGGGISNPVNVAVTAAGVDATASVVTGAASAITMVSATLAGSIPAEGCSAVTVYGIEYSTVNNFPTGTGTQATSANINNGNYTVAVSGLSQGTTYYYRAFAVNSGGTAYGAQQSFTTAAPPPPALSATTLDPFGSVCLTQTSGPNSFTVTGGDLTVADVTVGPLAGYSFSTSAAGPFAASLSLAQTGGSYSQVIYVRFTPVLEQTYNGNIPVGGGGAATINVQASGTGDNTLATVITGIVSDATNHSIVAAGSVAATGCSNVTSYGIEYSGINGFANGTGTQVAATNISGNNFSSALAGLVQGATYYYKAYAANSGGTSYGLQQSFTVPAIEDGFKLYPSPVKRGTEIRITMNNLTPGYYGLLLFDTQGRLVFQKNMNIQVDFINQVFTIPGSLQTGFYTAFLMDYKSENVGTRRIVIY